MSQINIFKWAVSVGVALIWAAVVFDVMPGFALLIDGEVWLTNHFADPILFAFVSGTFLAVVLSPAFWRCIVTPLIGAHFKRKVEEPAALKVVPADPIALKLVVSESETDATDIPYAADPVAQDVAAPENVETEIADFETPIEEPVDLETAIAATFAPASLAPTAPEAEPVVENVATIEIPSCAATACEPQTELADVEPVSREVLAPQIAPLEPTVFATTEPEPIKSRPIMVIASPAHREIPAPAAPTTETIEPERAPKKRAAPIAELAMPNPVVQLAARFEHWDTAATIKTWQVAWLWNDWEPVSEFIKGKPCFATYLRLEEHLEAGLIDGAVRGEDGWKNTELSRQALVDYALTLGERPKFLFVEQRTWLSRQLREWRKLDIDFSETESYGSYGDAKLMLYKVLQIINSDVVAAEVRKAMRQGGCEGIARRERDGIAYGYERIPQGAWPWLSIDWIGNVTGRKVRYIGLLLKFKDGYLKGTQETTTAVEAYDTIETYVRDTFEEPARRHG
jgi:hypothetical protein